MAAGTGIFGLRVVRLMISDDDTCNEEYERSELVFSILLFFSIDRDRVSEGLDLFPVPRCQSKK